MGRRTIAQLVLAFVGFLVWGVGQRYENPTLTMAGIGFFAVATLLRFAKHVRR